MASKVSMVLMVFVDLTASMQTFSLFAVSMVFKASMDLTVSAD